MPYLQNITSERRNHLGEPIIMDEPELHRVPV